MFFRPHPRLVKDCGEELITKQSHKAECDIHNILRQYQRTGIINHINSQTPIYTDLPDELDYQTSLNTILQAQDAFATLPSKVRDHFNNDPALFLAAFADPSQEAQLREWGLLNNKPSSSNSNLSSSIGGGPGGASLAPSPKDASRPSQNGSDKG